MYQVTTESVSKESVSKRGNRKKMQHHPGGKRQEHRHQGSHGWESSGAKPNRAGVFLVWYQTFARHPRAESDGKEKEKILKKSLRLSVKMNFVDQKIFLGSADNESSNRVRKVKRKSFWNEINVSINVEKIFFPKSWKSWNAVLCRWKQFPRG